MARKGLKEKKENGAKKMNCNQCGKGELKESKGLFVCQNPDCKQTFERIYHSYYKTWERLPILVCPDCLRPDVVAKKMKGGQAHFSGMEFHCQQCGAEWSRDILGRLHQEVLASKGKRPGRKKRLKIISS